MPALKDDLLKLAKQLQLPPEEFDAVGIHAWPAVFQKIEAAFVIKTSSNTHFNRWRESLKGPRYSILFEHGQAYECLHRLIDAQEQVWFVACDIDRDPSKSWLFQGKIQAIQSVLREHHSFEYYPVSKKYEWLVCETDHSLLVGLKSMIPKMEALLPVVKSN
ncbi:DUF6756 family protein [Hymenobacter arizonensis]|uniref:Uncharacterized protein n=1 Tax=Hymenobacter arizonensis TaxID=1227077 RepID=A0A1I5Z034_HYMAR|nr:DUF6756 family protein [Hymenobacter arizonensis]SFQ49675.1 hypothetical protein SAMN04515668_2570 [Hymenobacter arizonensis]